MRLSLVLIPVAAIGVLLGGLSSASSTPIGGTTWVATPNGIVGVQQVVTLRAPSLKGSTATFTLTTSSGSTNADQASMNSEGFAYLPWTPNLPGTWAVAATGGGQALDSASVTVAAMPTSTQLLVQGEVQPNVTVTIVANVAALGGSITPSGTVFVRNSANSDVATGTLSPTSASGVATVSMN